MVTAETAIVLPFVVLVAVVLTWVVSLGATQMRVNDAARDAARMLARGQSQQQAIETVREHLPRARTQVRTEDGIAIVRVRSKAKLPLIQRAQITLTGRAETVIE